MAADTYPGTGETTPLTTCIVFGVTRNAANPV